MQVTVEQESPSQSSTTLLTAVSLANALGMQLSSLTGQGGAGGGVGGGGSNSATTSSSSGTAQQQQQPQQGQQGTTSNLTAAQMMMVGIIIIILGEPERVPNTRETGSGIYIFIFMYLCVILHSNDSMPMLRHDVVDCLP